MKTENTQRGRGRPKTLDRDYILDVAMRCYWAEGVEAISLNEICRRAKVSKPALYREFGNEDGLTKAALSRYYEQVLTQLHQIFNSDKSYHETLDLLIELGLEASTNQGYPKGCLFVGMRNSAKQVGPNTLNEIEQTNRKILNTYRNWFEQSKNNHEFKSKITTEFAATYLHSQLSNAMNQQASGENADTIKNVLRLAVSVLR